ncbi:class I adenylate-forming enzyme family protein [Variovorax sp. LT1R16]|uniref:class I adenylate-forming enzyme family protein n=1 Tax=Variovorax sp. LT1R16 TaxID=3443728 RepID=UPI003F47EBA3
MPNIYQTLAYHAVRQPDAVALSDANRQFTYRQFVNLVKDVAQFVQDGGVKPGDRVAIVADNSIEYVALIYATALAGFVLVPLNTRYSADEIRHALEDCEPSLLLYEARFASVINEANWQTVPVPVARELDSSGWRMNPVRGTLTGSRFGTVSESDLCMILYTSGTTSRPKGAMLSHQNFVWNCLNNIVELELTRRNRAIMVSPLFHINAFGVLNGAILYAGGSIFVMSKFEARAYADVVEDFRPTNIPLLSVMWVDLVKELRNRGKRFDFVDALQAAASPLSEQQQNEIVSFFPNAEWGWGFGQTECCGTSIRSRFRWESEMRPGTTGHFWRHVEWRLVDDNGLSIAELPATGELQVRGPTVFPGYWKKDSQTRETLTSDGWLRTGDILRVEADEYAFFVGRSKDMVKTGGENVAALEVERALIEHPAVQEAGAFGLPHERWGEELVAAIVLRPGMKASADEVKDFMRKTATGFKVPKRIFIVPALPQSSSGKVQKFALREQFSAQATHV